MSILGLFLVTVATLAVLWLMHKYLAPKDDDPPEWFWILKGVFHRNEW